MTLRIENWPEAMAAVVVAHARQPFTWSASDCFSFPLDVAAAVSGYDPRAEDPPDYADEDGARAELARHGWETIADAFAEHFEEQPNLALARRGDIGIANYPGAVLGGGCVIEGTRIFIRGPATVLRLPRGVLQRAFKVGW